MNRRECLTIFAEWGVSPWISTSSIETSTEDEIDNAWKSLSPSILPDVNENPRIVLLRTQVNSLPVGSEYKESLLKSIQLYREQILNRPVYKPEEGWDDLEALQQATLGDSLENWFEKQNREKIKAAENDVLSVIQADGVKQEDGRILLNDESLLKISRLEPPSDPDIASIVLVSWVRCAVRPALATFGEDGDVAYLRWATDNAKVLSFQSMRENYLDDLLVLVRWISTKEIELSERLKTGNFSGMAGYGRRRAIVQRIDFLQEAISSCFFSLLPLKRRSLLSDVLPYVLDPSPRKPGEITHWEEKIRISIPVAKRNHLSIPIEERIASNRFDVPWMIRRIGSAWNNFPNPDESFEYCERIVPIKSFDIVEDEVTPLEQWKRDYYYS